MDGLLQVLLATYINLAVFLSLTGLAALTAIGFQVALQFLSFIGRLKRIGNEFPLWANMDFLLNLGVYCMLLIILVRSKQRFFPQWNLLWLMTYC